MAQHCTLSMWSTKWPASSVSRSEGGPLSRVERMSARVVRVLSKTCCLPACKESRKRKSLLTVAALSQHISCSLPDKTGWRGLELRLSNSNKNN